MKQLASETLGEFGELNFSLFPRVSAPRIGRRIVERRHRRPIGDVAETRRSAAVGARLT